jgi:hypothetical protein
MKNFVLLRSVKSFLDAKMIQGFLLSHDVDVTIDSSRSGDLGGAKPAPFSNSAFGIQILVKMSDFEKA